MWKKNEACQVKTEIEAEVIGGYSESEFSQVMLICRYIKR